jgi:hypothetical protein
VLTPTRLTAVVRAGTEAYPWGGDNRVLSAEASGDGGGFRQAGEQKDAYFIFAPSL